MGFLNSIKSLLRGQSGAPGSGGGSSSFGGNEKGVYWIYAQCQRCGEPLRARVNLYNDLSEAEDDSGLLVRKGLVGAGANRCYQTVEVTLKFDRDRKRVLESNVGGGKLITAEAYEALKPVTSNE